MARGASIIKTVAMVLMNVYPIMTSISMVLFASEAEHNKESYDGTEPRGDEGRNCPID